MINFTEMQNIVSFTSQRLLKDSEIADAIKKNHITLEDPDEYLIRRRDDLIQPASMDLTLRNAYSVLEVDGMEHPKLEYIYPVPVHPDLDRSFATFWPGYQTEASVNNLRWHNGKLIAAPELRSTLRRVGLDIGFNPKGVGYNEDQYGFLYIRNPQDYPVSVRKGEKIAQVLWVDRGIKDGPNAWDVVERENKFGSGRLITSTSELIDLVEQGEIHVSDKASVGKGALLFHAGRIRTYCNQEHVIIDDKGVHGFDVKKEDAINHTINPGVFSDIETIERIGLGPRVAMHVFYTAKPIHRTKDPIDMLNSYNTFLSTGGWVDPGYGFNRADGAPFSVQRKAFTKPVRIKQGQLVGYGVIWLFPEPVDNPYSEKRGSHYNDAKGFVAPRVK